MDRRSASSVVVFGIVGLGAMLLAPELPHRPARAPAHPDDLTSLVDQNGRRFSFEALERHTVVMSFIFTRCPVSCPLQTKALVAVQRRLATSLRGRVQLVSVTMDPERDTPAVLKEYAAALGVDLADWSFVTGDERELSWLHRHFSAQVKRRLDGQFDHRVAVYLLDAHRNLIQTYTGDFDQIRLVKEIGEVDGIYNKS